MRMARIPVDAKLLADQLGFQEWDARIVEVRTEGIFGGDISVLLAGNDKRIPEVEPGELIPTMDANAKIDPRTGHIYVEYLSPK